MKIVFEGRKKRGKKSVKQEPLVESVKSVSGGVRGVLKRDVEQEKEEFIKKYKLDEPVELDLYNLKKLEKWFSLQWFKRKYNNFLRKDRLIMIRMETLTGDWITRVVAESMGGFRFKGKKYVFDNVSKVYDRDFRLWVYTYHEDCSIPIKVSMDVEQIKDVMKSTGDEVEMAINPRVLSNFIDAEIMRQMFEGAGGDLLKRMFILLILNLLVTAGLAVLVLHETGILGGVTGG